jgi:integrase
VLALLLACGLRRHEAVTLTMDHLQQREEHWAIVDLVGKAGHVRTVPVSDWVKRELDEWLAAAAVDRGKVFRRGEAYRASRSTRLRGHGETA